MLGAIFGDIVGAPYEFNPIKTEEFPLFSEASAPTDDSLMTIAVADGLMTAIAAGLPVGECVARAMRRIGRAYPKAGFGGRFLSWLMEGSDEAEHIPAPYGSWGNGSAMRTSAVAWLFGSIEDVEGYAGVIASITHNHPEGIKGAQATAAAVFLARMGDSRFRIRRHIEEVYGYDLSRTLDEIRPEYSFDVSCQGTVPQAIIAFLESRGFEDAVRKAVSLGGDSDTLAAITGSIAEAYYGMPAELVRATKRLLPPDMLDIVEKWHSGIWRMREMVGVDYGDPFDEIAILRGRDWGSDG